MPKTDKQPHPTLPPLQGELSLTFLLSGGAGGTVLGVTL